MGFEWRLAGMAPSLMGICSILYSLLPSVLNLLSTQFIRIPWASASCLMQDSMSSVDALQQPTQNAVLSSADLISLSCQIDLQTSEER